MTDSARPLLEGQIETRQGSMNPLDAAWTSALNIWIARFREAQRVIRELEVSLESLEAKADRALKVAEAALSLLTDEQLEAVEKMVNASISPAAPDNLLPLIPGDTGCGDNCGCSRN